MDSYTKVSRLFCQKITKTYSTSFSLGVRMLVADLRLPIYAIYAFARLADEIVDTFKEIDQAAALARYKADTYLAIQSKFSTNPALQAFQETVHRYALKEEWINDFFRSMEWDLNKRTYNEEEYRLYIRGSAEVIGLMCLAVFCGEDKSLLASLEEPAKRLGAAFQKVNFLRDLRSDSEIRERSYFPQINKGILTETAKRTIEAEIEQDFQAAWEGIIKLPKTSRYGVKLAYRYYYELFNLIQKRSVEELLHRRIRVSSLKKTALIFGLAKA